MENSNIPQSEKAIYTAKTHTQLVDVMALQKVQIVN